jgi:nucleoside-diphosphate-sugar epimerase
MRVFVAAWSLWETCKERVGWDLVILNPPFVFGVSLDINALSSLLTTYIFRHSKPTIQEVTTPSTLNFSSLEFYNTVIARTESMKKLGNAWIDVRDLAEAHVRGLEREEAGGERIIVSAGEFCALFFCCCGDGVFMDVVRLVLLAGLGYVFIISSSISSES